MKLIPCRPADDATGKKKACYLSDWANKASDSPEQIKHWAVTFPDCLWGVPTGDVNANADGKKLFVIDIDVSDKLGSAAIEAFDRLKDEIGPLPATFTAETPRGGYHVFFWSNVAPTSASRLAKGIDTRGDGGYVIQYKPIDIDRIAELPEAWERALVEGRKRRGKGSRAVKWRAGDDVAEGGRNDTLFRYAAELGRKGANEETVRTAVEKANAALAEPLSDTEVEAAINSALRYTPEFTETAQVFEIWCDTRPDFRYHRTLGWHAWDGVRWVKDVMPQAIEDAFVEWTREQVLDDDKSQVIISQARSFANARAAERRAQQRLLLPDDDSDVDALHVANGIVDLKTGALLPPDKERFSSACAPTAYNPSAACPRFERFLSEIMDDVPERTAYLRRAMGYWLSGRVHEKAAWFMYGPVSFNGKSTLLDLLPKVLGIRDQGGYVAVMQRNPLLMGGGKDFDSWKLAGARIGITPELPGDVQINGSQLKDLTSPGLKVGERKGRDTFQYMPTAKLLFESNPLPNLDYADPAVRARAKLVLFQRRFDIDGALPEVLAAEAEGVLALMVRECVAWYREGLLHESAADVATIDAEIDLGSDEGEGQEESWSEFVSTRIKPRAGRTKTRDILDAWHGFGGSGLTHTELARRLRSIGCSPCLMDIDGRKHRGWHLELIGI